MGGSSLKFTCLTRDILIKGTFLFYKRNENYFVTLTPLAPLFKPIKPFSFAHTRLCVSKSINAKLKTKCAVKWKSIRFVFGY